jgi:hypothetical protein
LSEWPVGRLAHRTGVPSDDQPIAAASSPQVDNVKTAAEIPTLRIGLLSVKQADDDKVIRQPAGGMVALLARVEFESI